MLVGQWGEVGILGSVLGSRWLSEWGFALVGEKIAEWKSSLFPGWYYFRKTAGLGCGTGDSFQGLCPHTTALLHTWLDENFKYSRSLEGTLSSGWSLNLFLLLEEKRISLQDVGPWPSLGLFWLLFLCAVGPGHSISPCIAQIMALQFRCFQRDC